MEADRVYQVRLDQIERGENIRTKLDEFELKRLALSVKAIGFQVPLELVPGETLPYRVLDGWRRLCAAKLLGLQTVPAHIRGKKPSEGERLQQQLVINTQRAEPKKTDQARALVSFIEMTGCNAGEAGSHFGYANSEVTSLRKLLSLEPEIQKQVDEGLIPLSTATVALVAIEDDPEKRADMADRVAKGQLTREAAIEEVKRWRAAKTGLKGADQNGRTATKSGSATAPKATARQFKAVVRGVSVTVATDTLIPELVLEALDLLCSQIRTLQSRGVTREVLFRSLADELKAQEQQKI